MLLKIYKSLYKEYGPQGWWPLTEHKEKTGSPYHPKDYSFPKTEIQTYEICIGAILTQNTAWKGAEKALEQLKKLDKLKPAGILGMKDEKLKHTIRSAGYYNQKAIKLKEFTKFFNTLNNNPPTRKELLTIWGIGKETADSMLLYGFKKPTFIIDTYTKRMLSELGICTENDKYDKVKSVFEENIKPSIPTYQEYHALIVEHGKKRRIELSP